MDFLSIKDKVLSGGDISREEAIFVYNYDLEGLAQAADEIRESFMDTSFDICSILNVKSGLCPEDCKFCAQSIHYGRNSDIYPLIDEEKIFQDAKRMADAGVMYYSYVASGKSVEDSDVDTLARLTRRIVDDLGIKVCSSLGILSEENLIKLKEAGVSRIHNNLETSRSYFPQICTSHSYDEKIRVIKEAQDLGFEVCSGGIFGIGESIEDRIDLAFELKNLNIKSVPINALVAIEGTPLENNPPLRDEDLLRIVASYRFILPDAYIRLAGGRKLFNQGGKKAFSSGANACISGDLLTTQGIGVKDDLDTARDLGYSI